MNAKTRAEIVASARGCGYWASVVPWWRRWRVRYCARCGARAFPALEDAAGSRFCVACWGLSGKERYGQ